MAVAAHAWIMRVPGCASCHASIAVSHSSPPRAVSEAGKSPSSSFADVLVQVEHRGADGLLALGFEDIDRGEQFGKLAVLADQRSDVLGEHRLARHDPKQPGFLTLPVRGQFGRHLAQQVACTAQVAAVDRTHGVPTEVGGTLVLRDVVAQQRHLPAPAVVAHFPLDTTGPRHLCLQVAPGSQISTDHRPAHPHIHRGITVVQRCTHGCNGTPSSAAANAYRFPRNMIRSATASIPRGICPA